MKKNIQLIFMAAGAAWILTKVTSHFYTINEPTFAILAAISFVFIPIAFSLKSKIN